MVTRGLGRRPQIHDRVFSIPGRQHRLWFHARVRLNAVMVFGFGAVHGVSFARIGIAKAAD